MLDHKFENLGKNMKTPLDLKGIFRTVSKAHTKAHAQLKALAHKEWETITIIVFVMIVNYGFLNQKQFMILQKLMETKIKKNMKQTLSFYHLVQNPKQN